MFANLNFLARVIGDSDENGNERRTWIFFLAPGVCVVMLFAAAVAGVLRALGWLNSSRLLEGSRKAVRWSSYGALSCGFLGLLFAGYHFYLGLGKDVPLILLLVTLATYVFLFSALLFARMGVRLEEHGQHEGHEAYRQAARAALMGGLACGLLAEGLCKAGDLGEIAPHQWRQGCATLGASSGLLLLGLYTAQQDGSWTRVASPIDEDPRPDSTPVEEVRPNAVGFWPFGSQNSNAGGLFSGTDDVGAPEASLLRLDSDDSRFGHWSTMPSWITSAHGRESATTLQQPLLPAGPETASVQTLAPLALPSVVHRPKSHASAPDVKSQSPSLEHPRQDATDYTDVRGSSSIGPFGSVKNEPAGSSATWCGALPSAPGQPGAPFTREPSFPQTVLAS